MPKTQTARKNEWNNLKYERVTLMVKAGERETLQTAARAEGLSVNRFILESINSQHPGLLSLLDDESKKKKEPQPEAEP